MSQSREQTQLSKCLAFFGTQKSEGGSSRSRRTHEHILAAARLKGVADA